MTPADVDRAARSLLLFLADAALRAVVVAAVLGAVVFVLRRRGAALQLKGWTIVLFASLAIPVLSLLAPAWRWSIPILPAVQTQSAVSSPVEFAITVSAAPGPAAAPSSLSPWLMMGAIYALGVLVLCIHAVLAWTSARRLRSLARSIDAPAMLAALDRHAAAAGLTARPILLESDDILVPATMSVRQPVVLLPGDWRDWPAERLNAALVHEVAHIARRDALTQRISLFYRAALWISPLSWWLHSQIASLAEQASDEAALRAGVAPVTYAETLLECFARVQQGRHPRPAMHVAMARRADANAARRVDRILTWKSGGMIMRPKLWIVGLALVALPVVAVTAAVQFAPATPGQPAVLASVAPAPVAPVPAAPVPAAPESVAPVPAAPVPVAPTKTRATKPVTPATTGEAATSATSSASAPRAGQQTSRPVVIPPDDDFAAGAYDDKTPGITPPQVLREQMPRYSSDAMRAKVQGAVVVEAIVGADGRVEKARVIRSLDPVWGLDEEALTAAKKWLFTPAVLDGQAVRVRIILELEFRLH